MDVARPAASAAGRAGSVRRRFLGARVTLGGRGGRDRGDRRGVRRRPRGPSGPGDPPDGGARRRRGRGRRRAPSGSGSRGGEPGRRGHRRPAGRRRRVERRHGSSGRRTVRRTAQPQCRDRDRPGRTARDRARAGSADRELPGPAGPLHHGRAAGRRLRHRPVHLRPAEGPGDRVNESGRWSWIDLRLAPAAATSWLVTLAAPGLAPVLLIGLSGAAAVLGLLLVRRRRAAAVVVLGMLAALALSTAAAAGRASVRDASPLRAAAEQSRTVQVELQLRDLPRRLTGAGPPRVVADATVHMVRDGARAVRVQDDVLLFAPGDSWGDVSPGQPLRVRGTVSLPLDGYVVATLSARGPPIPVGAAAWPQRVAQALRDGLAGSSSRVLGPGAGGLLPGLVVGDTSAMDPVLTEDFTRTGLAHLTAVSGANVAIIVAGVLWPLRRRAVGRRVQALVAGLALAGFVVLAGPSASVLRAAVMGAVTLVALASGRERAAVPALCASVLVLLFVEPALATDGGFALSVAATAAVVLLAPGWSRSLRRRGCPTPVADALAVSAAAGLATAPLVAGLSGQISLVSLPANLLAAPAVAPATVLGLVAALVSPLSAPIAGALVWLAGWPVRWLLLVAERGGALPDAVSGWTAGTAGAVLLTLLLAAGGGLLWRFPRARPVALAGLVGLVLLGWPLRQAVRGWPPESTVVVACDVGQGDALVVPTAPEEAVLVDTGPEAGSVDRCLDRLGVDRLRMVVLSHLDADH